MSVSYIFKHHLLVKAEKKSLKTHSLAYKVLQNLNLLLLVFSTVSANTLATPKKEWQPTLNTVAKQMHQLRSTLNIGSLVLVAGILHMHAWLQWPATLMQDPSQQSAISGAALAITVF